MGYASQPILLMPMKDLLVLLLNSFAAAKLHTHGNIKEDSKWMNHKVSFHAVVQ